MKLMRTSILTTTTLALGLAACSGATTGANTPHSGQPLAPLFVLVLLGRSRRGRSRRLKSQLKADVAEIAAHRGIPS